MNPPGALTQSEAGVYFLLETLNCRKRLWLGRLSHLHQRQGREAAPPSAHYSHTQNPILALLPTAGWLAGHGQGSKARTAGEGGLPSRSPHPKGLSHSHGYREAGEAIDLPKAMGRAWRPFKFPTPSSYTHHSQQVTQSNPEGPRLRLLLRQLCLTEGLPSL